ncbi:MAG: PadR family transcriptional regulator [Chloroflexi bacterium]|nr:PadR family transcriptional regulator [Chloroflexota bacterium]
MEKLDQMRKGTTTLAILKLLVDRGEPMHGYQIARALETRSQGSFQFKEGLVYPRLHQMEHEGLLKSEWEGKRGGRRRKVYSPTAEGKQRLAQELKQWQAFSLSMEQLLGLAG